MTVQPIRSSLLLCKLPYDSSDHFRSQSVQVMMHFKVRENIRTELGIKKQQLEEIITYKTQGTILRSKVKWYNKGEKNTKYFHNLEKRHFNSKTIRYLQSANGKKLSTDVEILDEAKSYNEIFTRLQVLMSMIMIIFFFPLRLLKQSSVIIKKNLAKAYCQQRNA